MKLPLYQSHKKVRASKITEWVLADHGSRLDIVTENGTITLDPAWALRHKPEVGGYYVVYEDGYASYSPAQAFEEGYTRIEETAPGAVFSPLQPHQQRVVAELDELATRLVKLQMFTESAAFAKISPDEQRAMTRQEQAMTEYLGALSDRLELWGIKP